MGCASCSSSDTAVAADNSAIYWLRLGVALVLAGQGMVFGLAINIASPTYGSQTYWYLHGALLVSAVVVMALLGPRLIRESLISIRSRKLTVEALFVASCLGAFVGSLIATFTGEGAVYYEVVAIVLAVYSVGKRIGDVSRQRVLQEINQYRMEYQDALKVTGDGYCVPCKVDELCIGDHVRILPGKPITVDGRILEGSGSLRESHLSGEPVPVQRHPGMEIYAGSWSIDASLLVQVDRPLGERKMDTLLDWVENARRHPSGLQEEADRTIAWFFPFVVLVAVSTFVGWWMAGIGWAFALFNSMAVLLVACPCALGLATPIAVWKGMFRLASMGLLCRHGQAFDALGRCERIFFDKTGTLSEARLIVSDFLLRDDLPFDASLLVHWVAALEKDSEHPVARALAALSEADHVSVRQVELIAGKGLRGIIQEGEKSYEVRIGHPSLFQDRDTAPWLELANDLQGGVKHPAQIWIDVNGLPAAVALVSELLRPAAEESLRQLRKRGLAIEILSGDPNPTWENIGGVQIDKGLSPEEKRKRVEESSQRGEWPVYVGDGINDAPAMVAGGASIGVSDGAQLVREVSDAILLQSDLSRIALGIDFSRRVRQRVGGNIRFALVYNVIGITLAAAGILHPVVAALLMVCSSALVSVRALNSVD